MIVEVAIGSALVALGVVALRALRRRHDDLPQAPQAGRSAARRTQTEPPTAETTDRQLGVGDVILYGGTEYWLSGRLTFDEPGYAFSLFPTPGSRDAEYALQVEGRSSEVALMRSTVRVPDGLLPDELPLAGRRMTNERRGQAVVSWTGEQLPERAPRAAFALFDGAGGHVLLVVDFEDAGRLSLVGERVPDEMYDVLPGTDP